MRFRKSSHAVYKTEYHIVWTPRYRRKIFVKGVKQYMEKAILGIGLDPDIEVIKVTCRPLRWDGELRDKYRDKDGRKYRRLALGLVE